MATESDSFMGSLAPLDEITGKLKVVSVLHTSSNGPYCILLAERMGRRFVLKTLKEEFKNDPVYTLMLRREFEIGFGLDHPCIARTLALEDVEGVGECIIEEYVAGKTLREIIDSKEADGLDLLRIAEKITQTLVYLHSRQIVHHDLKPSNIIISEFDGTPRLIDFGFADSPGYESLKFTGGTSSYMAPERLEADYRSDPRSDVWSLGLIFREMAGVGDKDSGQLKRLAAHCLVPLERRRNTQELIEKFRKKNRKMLPVLLLSGLILVVAGIVLFFVLAEKSGEGKVESAPSGSFAKDTLKDSASSPPEMVVAPVNSEKTNHESPEQPKEQEKKEIKKEEKPLLLDEYQETYYLTLALNYARRITGKKIEKMRTEGTYRIARNTDELMAQRFIYDEVMGDIERYVKSLKIPSPEDQENIIGRAQEAAREVMKTESSSLE